MTLSDTSRILRALPPGWAFDRWKIARPPWDPTRGTDHVFSPLLCTEGRELGGLADDERQVEADCEPEEPPGGQGRRRRQRRGKGGRVGAGNRATGRDGTT
jgi:hypothetical protein